MAFEKRKYPEFSWSVSREKMFNDCQICYMLHYYGAHNGWFTQDSGVDNLAKSAYRWKTTVSIDDFVNSSILDGIHTHLYKQPMEPAVMLGTVRKLLINAFMESRDKKQDWYRSPKHVNMLKELVYVDELSRDLLKEKMKIAEQKIHSFYAGPTMQEIKETNVTFLQADKFTNFILPELNRVKVFVGLNVMYRRNTDNKVVVVNYRGNNEEISISQLGMIGFYLNQNRQIPLTDIIIRDEYLLTGKVEEHTVDEHLIDLMYRNIEDSIGMMAELVIDGDLIQNAPVSFKDVSRNKKHANSSCAHSECAYCECVRRDLQKYSQGYYPKYA